MKFQIKSRFDLDVVLFEGEGDSLKVVVEAAIAAKVVLSGAYLSGADLRGAYLSGAYLRGAYLSDTTTIDTGETWKDYLAKTVPALLVAGGKTIAAIIKAGAWKCHSWQNCPMAEAFGVHSIGEIPILLRPRAEQFIKFFDSGLIPEPAMPEEAAPKPRKASKKTSKKARRK